MMRYALLFLILSPFFLTGQSTSYQSLLIPEQFRQKANSCIRSSKTSILIEDQDEMIVVKERVVSVFNEEGLEDARIALFHDNDIRVKELELKVFDASGKEVEKFKERDFKDVSASGSSTMYSDARFYVLDYKPKSYPVTFVMNSEIKNENTAFISSWQPIETYHQSVMKSILEIKMSENFGLRYKKSNLDFVEEVDFERTPTGVRCTAKNIKALQREDFSPGLNKFTPQVKFALSDFSLSGIEGSAETWQELGKWQFENLIDGRDEISKSTRAKIEQMVAGIEDPVERARKVYEHVQDKTRYISIQVGIGGWQPVEASEVDELEYGDCKALTNYTKALLKIADVPANYAVVYAGSTKRDIDKDFPSMQGNHVILNLPQQGQEDIWLECTDQRSPFGFIGDFTDDRNVVLIKEDGGEVIKTPAYYEKDNSQHIDAALNLNEKGDLTAEFSITSKGTQFDSKYRLKDLSERRVLNFYRNYYDHFKNIKIEDHGFEMDDRDVTFKENLKIKVKNYGQSFGKRLMFVPNALNQTFSVPDEHENRKAPFHISRGYYDTDELTYSIPGNMKVESIPENIEIRSKFGNYVAKFEQKENNKVYYKREMLVRKGKYDRQDYKKFRDFMAEIKDADQNKIILIKKPK